MKVMAQRPVRLPRLPRDPIDLRTELERAVEGDHFGLEYQPIIDLQSGAIAAVEALLRWRHPTRGLLPPASFVPLAEETGLILPIGEWVLGEACQQLRRWSETEAQACQMMIGVNLSPRQLADPGLVETVAAVLESTGLEPASLCLEITESTVPSDPSGIDALHSLKSLGVTLALDDFGTGYSSLSAVDAYPIDILKIDRSFVNRLGNKPEASDMVGAVIDLAHSLGLMVVAEGVEREHEVRELRRLGCDAAQGFLFTVPCDAERLAAMLSREFALPQ